MTYIERGGQGRSWQGVKGRETEDQQEPDNVQVYRLPKSGVEWFDVGRSRGRV